MPVRLASKEPGHFSNKSDIYNETPEVTCGVESNQSLCFLQLPPDAVNGSGEPDWTCAVPLHVQQDTARSCQPWLSAACSLSALVSAGALLPGAGRAWGRPQKWLVSRCPKVAAAGSTCQVTALHGMLVAPPLKCCMDEEQLVVMLMLGVGVRVDECTYADGLPPTQGSK